MILKHLLNCQAMLLPYIKHQQVGYKLYSSTRNISRITIYYGSTFCIIPLYGMLSKNFRDIHPIWDLI